MSPVHLSFLQMIEYIIETILILSYKFGWKDSFFSEHTFQYQSRRSCTSESRCSCHGREARDRLVPVEQVPFNAVRFAILRPAHNNLHHCKFIFVRFEFPFSHQKFGGELKRNNVDLSNADRRGIKESCLF